MPRISKMENRQRIQNRNRNSRSRARQLRPGLRAIVPAEPDRPLANEVAHHDPVLVALAHRDLVDADHRRRRSSRLGQLGTHVLLVQLLHRMPVELQLLGDVIDRSAAASPADIEGKSLGVERIVRQKLETLALHLAAPAATHASHLELQEDAQAAGREIASAAKLAIIPPGMLLSAGPARRFFERRTSVTMRACGSPNTPRTSSTGRNPGNRYASSNRRRFVEVTRIRPPPSPSLARRNPFRFASNFRASAEPHKAAIHGHFPLVLG